MKTCLPKAGLKVEADKHRLKSRSTKLYRDKSQQKYFASHPAKQVGFSN